MAIFEKKILKDLIKSIRFSFVEFEFEFLPFEDFNFIYLFF